MKALRDFSPGDTKRNAKFLLCILKFNSSATRLLLRALVTTYKPCIIDVHVTSIESIVQIVTLFDSLTGQLVVMGVASLSVSVR